MKKLWKRLFILVGLVIIIPLFIIIGLIIHSSYRLKELEKNQKDYYMFQVVDKEIGYYRVYMKKDLKKVTTFHYLFCTTESCRKENSIPHPLIPYEVRFTKYEKERIKQELEMDVKGASLEYPLYFISMGNREYKQVDDKYKKEIDKNKDGKITHREYGDFLLRKVEMK